MVNWIIIVVILLIGFFIIKLGTFRHRFWIIFLILLSLFLYVTMTYVNKQNNLNFTSIDGIFKSLKIYAGWLANGFQNLKVLTGQAVKMDWTSVNSTFKDEKTDTQKNSKSNGQASVTFAK